MEYANTVEHFANEKRIVLSCLPKKVDQKADPTKGSVEDLLVGFLGSKGLELSTSSSSNLELRSSVFDSDYWSLLRRTRMYKTNKYF